MKRKRKSLKFSKQEFLYLLDECWELVFKFLKEEDEDNFKLLSTVSKQFLSITNSLRSSLTLYYPFLPNLFQRFTNLISLNLTCFHGDLNMFLSQISCFQLNLTSLNLSDKPTIPANGLRIFSKNITTLTSLTCSNLHSIKTTDLLLIADCFPLLEELDLSNPKECRGKYLQKLEALTIPLVKLRKVNLSGHSYINDQMIFHLFKNCNHLEEANLYCCFKITIAGMALALSERPSLRSFSFSKPATNITPPFIDSLVRLKSLTCLDLFFLNISDELLSDIAREGLPLRRIVLHYCTGYRYVGIFNLLSKCQQIQHLDLQNAGFLKDAHVVKLSLFLSDLVSINLSKCKKLTQSTLFALVGNCPTLGEIKMKEIGWESIHDTNFCIDSGVCVYPQLKYLNLASNSWLSDESIIMFASIFPNLELFDLNGCRNVSEEGVGQVLRRCLKIKHLNLEDCSKVMLPGINFGVSKLEVLNLSFTEVIDEALYVISNYCCQLLTLNLAGCDYITEKGVKHVIYNCTHLREINLGYCDNVRSKFVASMVVLRPSLRKITTPSHCYLSKKERKVFSNHGCLICQH
ncbi:F-box/LRR-repeat protein 3-like [Vicia villosa]|uniref:F-box/LRR-repeat protein 3-like n=1 Tax=Vicia villosa TaxID=3911 RepID=UPI00273CD28F|nr:F-box/LRR-repeat protein 3-like [Vicia villosa]